MKIIYVVFTENFTDCECKNSRIEREYVKTDNITKYIETRKLQIESHSYWWMDYRQDTDKRPYVMAKELDIKEI